MDTMKARKPREEFPLRMRRRNAAKYLGVSVRQLNDWQRAGMIPAIVYPNAEVRFDRGELAAFMERCKIQQRVAK
jgi:predicted site-specific integrase-resolvase